MERSLRRANVRWFSDRPKKRSRLKRSSPQQIVSLRLGDFARLFRSRYGSVTLPDDDAGRDDIEPVIHHLAALRYPARRAAQWLRMWAPWLTIREQDDIIAQGIINARPWTADQLAWRYRITKEERSMIGLTTIGAIDHSKSARTKRRKARDRARRAAERQRNGAISRAVYEANSIEHTKPWLAQGISRRTWYRRRNGTDTTASTA